MSREILKDEYPNVLLEKMKIHRKISKFILQNYLILADYSAPDTYGEATSHEDRTAAKKWRLCSRAKLQIWLPKGKRPIRYFQKVIN